MHTGLHGRQVIYTDVDTVTADNVIGEVNRAMLTHQQNRSGIIELRDIRRGITAIQNKEKQIRPEINHKVNENRAAQIEAFYRGYIYGEPIQYVRRKDSNSDISDDELGEDINKLNGYMMDADAGSVTSTMAQWQLTGGTGYKLTYPNADWTPDGDESPLKLTAPDPRTTFVAYSSGFDHEPVYGCMYVVKEDGTMVFDVYTNDSIFEFDTRHGSGVSVSPNPIGMIPLVEYPASEDRMGIFEPVVPLLDAIDELQSNRMDDIVQFVNSIMVVLGGEVDDDTYKKILAYKMMSLPEGADAKYIGRSMNQNDLQSLKNDLLSAVLQITGVPNRNGGSSTSDTGAATQLRDGWQDCETRAKSIEVLFKKSERRSMQVALRILRMTVGTRLHVRDIDAHFSRRNYENIVSKVTVLTTMLENGKIAPELAYAVSGIWSDPEAAYLQSKKYMEESGVGNTGSDTLSGVRTQDIGVSGNSNNPLPTL